MTRRVIDVTSAVDSQISDANKIVEKAKVEKARVSG